MAQTNLVKFVSCTAASFAGLGTKDANTLYFVSDEQRLYKGEVPYSGGIYKEITSFPLKGEPNVLYKNSTTGEVKFWNGTAYVQVVKPYETKLTAASDEKVPTSKAVADYVASEITKLDAGTIAADIDSLKKKDAEHDTAINTTLPNAIADAKKAGTDAITAVTTLENGKVADNTKEIGTLKTSKADKATTLAGYSIGDAYTKEETDTAIAKAVNEAGHLKREIVTQLPEVGAANEHTIYMVGAGEGAETSNYKEYMLVNGKFELVGDSKVDLTNYATKAYADSQATKAKEDAVAEAGTAADAKISTAIQGLDRADVAVEGQYVSAVSETDGVITVTRAPLPSAPTLVEGTDNGTVKFNGTDVKVHGLGSAAYTESTAYATAAQGVKADSALQKESITTGQTNGTIKVADGEVAVAGLGSAAYTNSDAYDVKGAATGALTSAKQYTDAEVAKRATSEQGAKADTALQQADITEGTVQGAISVKGASVKVHGLGSAAYAESNTFETAGAAANAQAEAIKQAKAYVESLLTWGTIG